MSQFRPLLQARQRSQDRGYARWMRATAKGLVLALALGVQHCGPDSALPDETGPTPQATELGAGIVARVGTDDITGTSVTKTAAAQKVDVLPARDLAIRDALFASEARARHLDTAPDVVFATQAVLARHVLRGLVADAWRAGPVTEDELRQATERHWLELDRPEGFRTVHAVVRVDENADDAKKKRAAALAAEILQVVRPAAALASNTPVPVVEDAAVVPLDPAVEFFKKAVEAVPRQDFTVSVEPLSPVAADGRVLVDGGGSFDPDFALAAAALVRRGDLAPLIQTSFGVHVILLIERIPERQLSIEERRRAVTDEVVAGRARAAQTKMLEELRRGASIDRSVDALLALVPIEP